MARRALIAAAAPLVGLTFFIGTLLVGWRGLDGEAMYAEFVLFIVVALAALVAAALVHRHPGVSLGLGFGGAVVVLVVLLFNPSAYGPGVNIDTACGAVYVAASLLASGALLLQRSSWRRSRQESGPQ